MSHELLPLPMADGSAETNKERHPDGGYTFDEVDAWSEHLVREYAIACAKAAIAAELERTTMSVYGTQAECKAARDALQRLADSIK